MHWGSHCGFAACQHCELASSVLPRQRYVATVAACTAICPRSDSPCPGHSTFVHGATLLHVPCSTWCLAMRKHHCWRSCFAWRGNQRCTPSSVVTLARRGGAKLPTRTHMRCWGSTSLAPLPHSSCSQVSGYTPSTRHQSPTNATLCVCVCVFALRVTGQPQDAVATCVRDLKDVALGVLVARLRGHEAGAAAASSSSAGGYGGAAASALQRDTLTGLNRNFGELVFHSGESDEDDEGEAEGDSAVTAPKHAAPAVDVLADVLQQHVMQPAIDEGNIAQASLAHWLLQQPAESVAVLLSHKAQVEEAAVTATGTGSSHYETQAIMGRVVASSAEVLQVCAHILTLPQFRDGSPLRSQVLGLLTKPGGGGDGVLDAAKLQIRISLAVEDAGGPLLALDLLVGRTCTALVHTSFTLTHALSVPPPPPRRHPGAAMLQLAYTAIA